MTRWQRAGALALALGGAFVAGRYSRAPVTVERLTDREASSGRYEYTRRVDVVQTVGVRTNVRRVVRWLPTPAGVVVEQTEETQEARDERAQAASQGRVFEVQLHERETTVERPAPRWELGAFAGWGIFGGEATYRLGPVRLGVAAFTDRRLMLTGKVAF